MTEELKMKLPESFLANGVWYAVLLYAVVVNIVAVIMTIYDKKVAIKKRRRIPEKTLMATAALSGCLVMYVTMHIIHHKTKHKLFMIGIPVMFLLELAAAIIICLLCGVISI